MRYIYRNGHVYDMPNQYQMRLSDYDFWNKDDEDDLNVRINKRK